MLARHDGVVVLVSGALPGERVRARVERSSRSLIFARAVDVMDASPSRRPPVCDPACGGMDYAHIAYSEQLRLKGEVIADAFRRIGKMSLDGAVSVEASPERGYRLRARLHVENGRVGFFLEGTHRICDAAGTGQLLPETMVAVQGAVEALGEAAGALGAVTVAENVTASGRVLHLECREDSRLRTRDEWVRRLERVSLDVSGITAERGGRAGTIRGMDSVTDTARELLGSEPALPEATRWRRRATSFFQGNRFVTGSLVRHVLALTEGDRVADLYAGVGLFAVALAARGAEVTAVEGDRGCADDLVTNAEPFVDRLHVVQDSVEAAMAYLPSTLDAVVLDPPRAGVSAMALSGVVASGARHVTYVSCDPATLARDAAVLVAAGYRVKSIRAFDLFPNTSHVETVAAFERL